MAAHKLTYFPLAGRAFPIRVCMKASGLPFEDVRLPGPEYREKKATMDLPLGQVPVLLIGDKAFCQSTALARYAAKKAGLYPKGGSLSGVLRHALSSPMQPSSFATHCDNERLLGQSCQPFCRRCGSPAR
jgi:glutathione S-transferase